MVVLSFSCPFTLKIDCEGCEYAAIPPLFDLISSGKASVNQVLIELHTSKSPQILYVFSLPLIVQSYGFLTRREINGAVMDLVVLIMRLSAKLFCAKQMEL
jgi:hypothetical protein